MKMEKIFITFDQNVFVNRQRFFLNMKVMNSDPDIKQLIGSGCGKIMRIWMRILNAAPKERRKQENEKAGGSDTYIDPIGQSI